MVNISTLFYVLENLEGNRDEAIDLGEILDLEYKYLKGIFEIIDRAKPEIRSTVMENILRSVPSH